MIETIFGVFVVARTILTVVFIIVGVCGVLAAAAR